ncbi:carbohydrate-binding module family 1 protein [Patellaria atrata CBS 101060]|uniref:AA9 family lytic polysaccharide monooxygenase n=1 Tax=Patellaria atrata CBS 101060 TaxID=1346257 RepID=A0A9P4VUC1_9PEZI|nr:carbohydrate-binding module family 1 protein [Patellaria atrata CBS 101060]
MKFSTFASLAISAAAVQAHTIFQKVSVNGVDQGQLKGVRAPDSDYPIENVNDGSFACNKNINHKDSTIINIPAGAKVGAWWGHVIGGKQGANDPDHPIAASHKGPIIVYLAKVDNAATTGTTGLKWFKISEDGLSGGKWAVDRMIANDGWNYFTMPSCIAPGNYLMRVELIALHNAYSANGAQFYMECAQINVQGSGTSTPSNTVSFPGAYQSNHPGIQISIYGTTGQPDNGGKAYQIPGPPLFQCGANSGGSDSGSQQPQPPTSGGSSQGTAALYAQCGGDGWTGPTTCASGTCKVSSQYYSQCLP